MTNVLPTCVACRLPYYLMFYLRLNYSSAAEPAAIHKSGKSRRSCRNSGFKDLLLKISLKNSKNSEKIPKNYLAQICTNNTNMDMSCANLTIYGNMTSYMIQNQNFELNAMVVVTCDRSNHIWKYSQFASKVTSKHVTMMQVPQP